MARNFVRASSQHLTVDASPVSGLPLSFAFWMKRGSNDLQTFFFIGDKDATNQYFAIGANGADGGGFLSARAGGTSATASGVTALATGTRYHLAGVVASATSRVLYLNGASDGTATASRNPSGLDRVSIGRLAGSSPSSYSSSDINDVAIWDVALDAAEIAILANGASPLTVRPSSLVFYAPLLGRHSPEIEIIGGLDLTVTGATAADHPRMFYPPTGLWTPKGASGGGPPPTNTRRYSLSLTGVG